MTVKEAIEKRIPRIRRAMWISPKCYLRLPLLDEGAGPWAELYDEDIQQIVLRIRPGEQKILMMEIWDEECEEYTGPISEFEKHPENYSRVYLDK